MQKGIDAEHRDLFDVLGYVAFALRRYTRQERADRAQPEIMAGFPMPLFVDFQRHVYEDKI